MPSYLLRHALLRAFAFMTTLVPFAAGADQSFTLPEHFYTAEIGVDGPLTAQEQRQVTDDYLALAEKRGWVCHANLACEPTLELASHEMRMLMLVMFGNGVDPSARISYLDGRTGGPQYTFAEPRYSDPSRMRERFVEHVSAIYLMLRDRFGGECVRVFEPLGLIDRAALDRRHPQPQLAPEALPCRREEAL